MEKDEKPLALHVRLSNSFLYQEEDYVKDLM